MSVYFITLIYIFSKLLAAKKLPCNHIFHTSCLRSWFQRHQTCPTCRLDILRSTPVVQPSAAAEPPAPPRTAQPTTSPPTAPSSNAGVNSQRPSTSNPSSVPGQARNIDNPIFNQTPFQYQFQPFTFQQQPTSNNESNPNNTVPQQSNVNESWTAFMNAAGLGGGIGMPTFFSKLIS